MADVRDTSSLITPDELDQRLQIVDQKVWVPLTGVAFVSIALVVWSVVGRIPITVEGVGVLVNPDAVKPIESPGSGPLSELRISEGDEVLKGQIIAIIDQPELRQQLNQKRSQLAVLESQHAEIVRLEEQQETVKVKSTGERRKLLESSAADTRQLVNDLKQKESSFATIKRQNLERSRELLTQQHGNLKSKVDKLRVLKADNLIPATLLLEAERESMDAAIKLDQIDVDLSGLSVADIENEQQYAQLLNRTADLELQLQQIDLETQQHASDVAVAAGKRDMAEAVLAHEIERLELALQQSSEVRSNFSGRILDLTVTEGQSVVIGARIATVERSDVATEMTALAYLPVNDGKLVTPEMSARVTPSTVESQRYGSLLGQVTAVSAFPVSTESAASVVGSQEIAAQLTSQESVLELHIRLIPDGGSISGFRWTSKGPPTRLSPGTTARVRITTERRSPISYLLPILREFTGIE